MKKTLSVSVEEKTFFLIEGNRGEASRSRYVEKLLEKALKEEAIGYA